MNATPKHHLTMALVLLLPFGIFPAAAASADAPDFNTTNFPRAGLCIYIGAGKNSLFTELATNTTLLIHGLAIDDAALDAARQQIAKGNLSGRVAVEKAPINPLPYVRDLANIVIIDDLDALSAKGLTRDEADRVLAPYGSLYVKKNGQWTKTAKPYPVAEMDEWPQTWHGADGNRVSSKSIPPPLGLRFMNGISSGNTASFIAAGGRTFQIFNNRLIVCDAFNGLQLWSCDSSAVTAWGTFRKSAALVADGKRVYLLRANKLVALDAATGAASLEFPVKYKTVRLLLLDGVLVSDGLESVDFAASIGTVPKSGSGAIEAFDAATGKRKWSVEETAQEILAADRTVYALLRTSSTAAVQRIIALDLQSGREKWSHPQADFAAASDLWLAEAGPGALVVHRSTGGKKDAHVFVLNAPDGAMLWDLKPEAGVGDIWSPIVNGRLWNGRTQYDLMTGKVVGEIPAPRMKLMGNSGCTPNNMAGTVFNLGHLTGCDFVDLSGKEAKEYVFNSLRAPCTVGIIPANGMYYSAQNWGCYCAYGQIPGGVIGFGPCGTIPGPEAFAAARTVEPGPAFGKIKAGAADPAAAYPIFLANPERSSTIPIRLASSYQLAWQTKAAVTPDGPLASIWAESRQSLISSPTVADGLVFVAVRETGQVRAFHADSGQPAWTFTAGGRVDSPPTLHAGLAFFGAHDGYLYALRAADGVLAWRTRLAPTERRMVAWGQMESVWPAPGSVLVHDGVLYATAGRETETDGGVVLASFDPLTGKQKRIAALPQGLHYQNDILGWTPKTGTLFFRDVHFDPATWAITPAPATAKPANYPKGGGDVPANDGRMFLLPPDSPADFRPNLDGLVDSSWLRDGGSPRAGHHYFGHVHGDVWAWNDTEAYGADERGRICFAITRASLDELNRTLPYRNTQITTPEAADRLLLAVGNARDRYVTIPHEAYAWHRLAPPADDIPTKPLMSLGLGVNTYNVNRAEKTPGQVTSLILTDSGVLIAGRIPKAKNAREFTGFCQLLAPDTGKVVAEFPMPAVPTCEALAVTRDRIFVSSEDGQLLCLEPGRKESH